MKIRRKGRPPTRGGWTPESSRKAHAAKARKRLESPPDNEPRRVPEGVYLGTLRWHAADGTVRQWIITQGDRSNNIAVASLGKRIICGWDRLFRSLRKRLAIPKRLF